MGFFEQELKYTDRVDRVDYFSEIIKNKRCLHYGCADWPIFDISNNLHFKLLSSNKNLVGYDIDSETIKKMSNIEDFYGYRLYHDKIEIKEFFDIVIVPETIEHVFNIEEFILEVSKFGKEIIITAPNALCDIHYHRNLDNDSIFTEIVHPDHKYWFSLYTLMNSIRMVLNKNGVDHKIEEVGFLEGRTMVYCRYSLKID